MLLDPSDWALASRAASRRSRTSRCPTPKAPCARSTGCARTCRCCSRCRTRNLAATPRPVRQLDLARGPDKLPGLVEALSALF